MKKLQFPFTPTIEQSGSQNETFLKECFLHKYQTGNFHRGDHMMGFTNTESNFPGRLIEDKFHEIFDFRSALLGVLIKSKKI